MGDAFNRLFLTIGIALGLAAGQPDPSLMARAELDGDAIVVSARVENAFASGAIELIETGTRVALRYSARVEGSAQDGSEASEIRSIRNDLRIGRYEVLYGAGKKAAIVDPQAARGLAAELGEMRIRLAAGAGEALARDARVTVDARIGIIDGKGIWHDAPVLWNYRAPRADCGIQRGPGEN